jgi:uncharacterized membrane protein YkoI
MSHKIAFAALLALSLPAVARADDVIPAGALPPAALVHQLVADGHDLRRLDYERGRYEARIRTAQGRLVKVAVDPRTGRPYAPQASWDKDGKDGGPAVAVTAVEAIVAAAGEGHYDVRELEFRDGRYRVTAADDAGIPARVEVDAADGRVASVVHFRDR